MSIKKKDRQFNDAKGNTHKHFADGRSEIYIGGFVKDTEYVECTDEADKSVNRKRFLRYIAPPVDETVQNNDPEIATREIPSAWNQTKEQLLPVEDDAMPGIDLEDNEN